MRDRKLLGSLSVVLLAAACGADPTSVGPGPLSNAGAAGQASAGAPSAGAPSAGAASAGAPSAGAPAAGASGAPTAGAPAGGAGGAGGGSAGAPATGTVVVMPPMNPTPVGNQGLPRKLYIENRCDYATWTLVSDAFRNIMPNSQPYKMEPHTAIVVGWPNEFSGRIWPRSSCTGSGYNDLKCVQTGADTLAEFTLTKGMNSDWYDVSLVDGFTIPVGILQLDVPWKSRPDYVVGGPLGSNEICGSPVCAPDLNPNCPASQQQKDAGGKVWGCKSGPKASDAAKYLKAGCPSSYSYDFDDPQSLFRCPTAAQNGGTGAKDYDIIYCPTQGSLAGFP
jgi:hypothetical protein